MSNVIQKIHMDKIYNWWCFKIIVKVIITIFEDNSIFIIVIFDI